MNASRPLIHDLARQPAKHIVRVSFLGGKEVRHVVHGPDFSR